MTLMQNHELASMLILFLGCFVVTVGGAFRKRAWSPWVMLLGICIVLAIIAFNILRHTHRFFV